LQIEKLRNMPPFKKCYLRDQTKDEAKVAACGLYGGTKEIYKGFWCVNLKKRDKIEDRS